MRILFVIDTLTSGGKERRLTELLKSLKLKPSIYFELVVMSNDIHYREILDSGISIHQILRKSKKDLSVFYKFYKLCKKYKPDIVHCWDSMSAVYLIPSCKILKIKLLNGMVVDAPVHQTIFNKHWFRAKLTFPFSHTVIGNSLAGLNAYQAPKYKSVCVYNGFNFNRIMNLKDPQELRDKYGINSRYIVVMVGAFSERKDYDTYVDAAINICERRKDIEFLAIGDGENINRIKKKISEKCDNKIKFLGKQSDVESFINISDICVLTTNTKVHGEGISNSILEYMALGKPVIATTGGGTNEIVEDGITGFLINPFAAEELTRKIELLLADKDLRNQLGSAAKSRVQNIFSIDQMTEKFISIYQSSIAGSKTAF